MTYVVAVIGCDGTGKTTIVTDMVAALRRERPTVRLYMGMVSGEGTTASSGCR